RPAAERSAARAERERALEEKERLVATFNAELREYNERRHAMSTERQQQQPETAPLPVVGHRIADTIVRDGARRTLVYDPARGAPTAEVVLGDAAVVDRAVAAAAKAFPAWSETTPLKRARVLFKLKELLEANAD